MAIDFLSVFLVFSPFMRELLCDLYERRDKRRWWGLAAGRQLCLKTLFFYIYQKDSILCQCCIGAPIFGNGDVFFFGVAGKRVFYYSTEKENALGISTFLDPAILQSCPFSTSAWTSCSLRENSPFSTRFHSPITLRLGK